MLNGHSYNLFFFVSVIVLKEKAVQKYKRHTPRYMSSNSDQLILGNRKKKKNLNITQNKTKNKTA
jgi:hypothetical protein